jgi:radical SAM superfamily enzyme YgiQ (UPF0313 family)
MKKIQFFDFGCYPYLIQFPTAVLNFKQYFVENSEYASQWSWILPRPSYVGLTLDDIVDQAIDNQADVYAFSAYIWNWSAVNAVAKSIKQRRPDSIIILGGPNQGVSYTSPLLWFRKFPWFDATCLPNEYGEWFLIDALESISQDRLDWSKVRNSYSRKGLGPTHNKKKFVWPQNTIVDNLQDILVYRQYAKDNNLRFQWIYETTRGCPYGCTFCEWSGGINSKVITKSLDLVAEELGYIPMIEPDYLYLADANFGLLREDANKARMIADIYTNCTHKFTLLMSGLAKTTSEKKLQVLTPLFNAGVVDGYDMSLQTVSLESLQAIKRTDVSAKDHMLLAQQLIRDYNAGINIGFILGLPGSTLKDFYQEFDIIYEMFFYRQSADNSSALGVDRSPMMCLPDSPASDPAYIKQHGIQLVAVGIQSEEKSEMSDYDRDYYINYDPDLISVPAVYFIIGCNTFDTHQWLEMIFLSDLDTMFRTKGVMLAEIKQARAQGMPYNEFFRALYAEIKTQTDFYQPLMDHFSGVVRGEFMHKDWRRFLLDGEVVPLIDAYEVLWIRHFGNIDWLSRLIHK